MSLREAINLAYHLITQYASEEERRDIDNILAGELVTVRSNDPFDPRLKAEYEEMWAQMKRQGEKAGPGPIKLEETLNLSEVQAIATPDLIKQAMDHPDTPSNDLAQEFFKRAGVEDPGFSTD